MEVAVSERAAWFGRWHLADRAAVFNSTVSIRSHKIASFWNALNAQRRSLSRSEQQALWSSIRRWLSINGSCHLDGGRSLRLEGMDFARTLRFQTERFVNCSGVDRLANAAIHADAHSPSLPRRGESYPRFPWMSGSRTAVPTPLSM